MSSRIMKWLSVATLLGGLLAQASIGYRMLLNLIVCVAALVVFGEAFQMKKYFWALGFVSIAVVFNPLVPLTLSKGVFLGLDLACIMAFAMSLAMLRSTPRLSVSGIIHPTRRIESL
jgi:hypothetical protein